MEELISIVNRLGQRGEDAEIRLQSLEIEKKRLKLQLEVLGEEKTKLLEDIQNQKVEGKQALESSMFLTEKNLKAFVRKSLSRFIRAYDSEADSDELEMAFETLMQSLECGRAEKEEIWSALFGKS